MVFITIIDRIFDHTQPARPWAELSEEGFAPPIRENWRFRIVVNLVWFARNYLNLCVALVLAVAYWFPGFLATVGITVFMHSTGQGGKRVAGTPRRLLQLAQLLSLAVNNYLYGWLSGFLFSVFVATLILLHSVFTPYTDERVKQYHAVVNGDGSGSGKRGSAPSSKAGTPGCGPTAHPAVLDGFAPRTPVMSYTGAGTGNFPLTNEPASTTSAGPAAGGGGKNTGGDLAHEGRRASKTFSDFSLPPSLQDQRRSSVRRRTGTAGPSSGQARPTTVASSLPVDATMGWSSQSQLTNHSTTSAAGNEPPPMRSPTGPFAEGVPLET